MIDQADYPTMDMTSTSSFIQDYVEATQPRLDQIQIARLCDELFPIFANAAWTLCRRGILRPGVSRHLAQATDQGSAGSGFS